MRTVAALFVDPTGVYSRMPGVECWGVDRDARRYAGPRPIVAHPPCQRWGRFARQGGRKLGDDDGCFASAVASARSFGGVIEHPYGSHAFRAHELPIPVHGHGWTEPDANGGRSISVDQGHYGHPTRKRTWVYGVGVPTTPFYDGPLTPRETMVHHYPQVAMARFLVAHGTDIIWPGGTPGWPTYALSKYILPKPPGQTAIGSTKAREATPPAFARALLSLSRKVRPW